MLFRSIIITSTEYFLIGKIFSRCFKILEEKEEITIDELIEILEKANRYKLAKDSAENDLEEIRKIINSTYRINKLNTIWKHKEASNKKVLANQLGGVSKVISSLADDIKTEEKLEPSKPKFKLIIGEAEATKNKSEVSGDSNIRTKLHDGKYMLAISDGSVYTRSVGRQPEKSLETGQKLQGKTLEELDLLWEKVKRQERQ